MSKLIQRIEALIPSLPDKDVPLGYKFLKERNFDSLRELVDSAIYKVKKSQRSENPQEKYANISIEDLSRLKSEVDLYISYLDISNDDCYDETEYELEEEKLY